MRSRVLARIGSGTGTGSGSGQFVGWGGHDRDFDARVEYSGVGPGVRVAGGTIVSRSRLREDRVWTEGLTFDLDLDPAIFLPKLQRTEIFLHLDSEDHLFPAWDEGHASWTVGDGFRWLGHGVGAEVATELRFEEGGQVRAVLQIGMVFRTGLTERGFGPPVPLSELRVARRDGDPPP